MKLYVISKNDYGYSEILGIFDDKQKAEKIIKNYKSYIDKNANIYVEEYILNNLTTEATETILKKFENMKNEIFGDSEKEHEDD